MGSSEGVSLNCVGGVWGVESLVILFGSKGAVTRKSSYVANKYDLDCRRFDGSLVHSLSHLEFQICITDAFRIISQTCEEAAK